jgi:hypothetical protein
VGSPPLVGLGLQLLAYSVKRFDDLAPNLTPKRSATVLIGQPSLFSHQ